MFVLYLVRIAQVWCGRAATCAGKAAAASRRLSSDHGSDADGKSQHDERKESGGFAPGLI